VISEQEIYDTQQHWLTFNYEKIKEAMLMCKNNDAEIRDFIVYTSQSDNGKYQESLRAVIYDYFPEYMKVLHSVLLLT
jgi:hypothetical protein